MTNKIFTTIATRYESRKGGYIRIIKNGFRYGDSAPQAIIELVDRDTKAKGLNSGPIQKKKKEQETTVDEKSPGTVEQKNDPRLNQKLSESSLKENQEIAKKIEKKRGDK